MIDSKFLKLFHKDLEKRFTAHDFMSLTHKSSDFIDLKLDSLLKKGLIIEHTYNIELNNKNTLLSERWSNGTTGNEAADILRLNKYSISNDGLEYISSANKSKWVNIRSWIAIGISLLALIFKFI